MCSFTHSKILQLLWVIFKRNLQRHLWLQPGSGDHFINSFPIPRKVTGDLIQYKSDLVFSPPSLHCFSKLYLTHQTLLQNLIIWHQILIHLSPPPRPQRENHHTIHKYFLGLYYISIKRTEREKAWKENRNHSQAEDGSAQWQHSKVNSATYRSHCPTCSRAPCLSGWGRSWTGLTGRNCGPIWPPCPKVSWHAQGTSLLRFPYPHLTLHWWSNLCEGAPFPHRMPLLFELRIHTLLTALG